MQYYGLAIHILASSGGCADFCATVCGMLALVTLLSILKPMENPLKIACMFSPLPQRATSWSYISQSSPSSHRYVYFSSRRFVCSLVAFSVFSFALRLLRLSPLTLVRSLLSSFAHLIVFPCQRAAVASCTVPFSSFAPPRVCQDHETFYNLFL